MRSLIQTVLLVFVVSFGLLLNENSVSAETMSPEQLETAAQAISETSMSPFCPGRTISSCPSPQARDLRGQIHTWLSQGYSEEAVRNQLLLIYGEDVRGTPQSEGFGLVGWTMPAVFVLLSVALLFLKLRRMKSEKRPPEQAIALDADAERRVDEALRRRAL